MILASHYIIKDVLHTLRSGNPEEAIRTCQKFSDRYREDSEFTGLCNLVIQYFEENKKDEKKLASLESKLEELTRFRVQAAASSMGLWYSERRKNI